MAWLDRDIGTPWRRSGAFSLVAVLTALVLGPLACKSSQEDPTAKKRVTAKDCEAWAEHGTTTMLASMAAVLGACPPDTRDDIRSQMAQDPVAIRAAANKLCMTHANEEYLARDAACFLRAADAPTLRACKLGPMTDPKDSDWATIVSQIREACTRPRGPGAGLPSGNGTRL